MLAPRRLAAAAAATTRGTAAHALRAARAAPRAAPPPCRTLATLAHIPPAVEADHRTLAELINHPQPAFDAALPPTGLCGIPSLRAPHDFSTLAQLTVVRAQLLVARIDAAGRPDAPAAERMRVVGLLDRLSDQLCVVIDLAEFVRNAHPEHAWAAAANDAYEILFNYMNVLNTHTGLYESLRRVVHDPAFATLSDEARAVARIFLHDFEKSGIHLAAADRQRFVALNDDILVRSFQFQRDLSAGAAEDGAVTDFPLDLLAGMDAGAVAALRSYAGRPRVRGTLPLAPGSWEVHVIQRYAPDPRARRLAYLINNTGRTAPVALLESFLHARGELGILTGKRSYAEMALQDKMAGSPEHVARFLRALAHTQRPAALSARERLLALKRIAEPGAAIGGHTLLEPWDREFYADRYAAEHTDTSLPPLTPFLSLGDVFAGLSRLFFLLYGIHLRAVPLAPGEGWSPDVIKLQVCDEADGGEIGTILCDLFARRGKPPSAAHYTIRCSRRIDHDDPDEDVRIAAPGAHIPTHNLLGIRGTALRGREGRYQLPIIALLCDFPSPIADAPTLLRWHEVETLFHEMGHAIHSMIGRTEFHNVSGTRCATDFVELPSILMEYFVAAPQVTGLFGRHFQTGAPLPPQLLHAHLATARALDGLETNAQILLAAIDQAYHSERAVMPGFSTSGELTVLNDQIGLMPSVPDTTWQGQFGHLAGYGATYYSYLFDRALARRVWHHVFAADPLSRAAGEHFKHTVLRFGGGRDPWLMLAELLGDHELAAGDGAAMERVGTWDVGA